ncbi:putative pre-mRNA-splicing factor ATP-dependent RNA helicase DEAH5 [Camellia lanceoleosa]|uniref:Pre-mRNA-splicing factor ATP-dependent RNA helicase DEAH5 n=1 Tax=Camellia lanceoleosa TaxID=1840588 RepID=A0ACC0I0B1_9ERIC|nr:putative pre-mRNA-splicing factor ATP-dependent RNA helicase DEAH5 [Camellia lanceoleosa]
MDVRENPMYDEDGDGFLYQEEGLEEELEIELNEDEPAFLQGQSQYSLDMSLLRFSRIRKDDRRPEESRGKQRKAIPGCRRENQSDPVVAAAREMVLQTLLLPLLQTLLLPLQERHNDDWVRGRVCVSNRRENKRVT